MNVFLQFPTFVSRFSTSWEQEMYCKLLYVICEQWLAGIADVRVSDEGPVGDSPWLFYWRTR